MSHYNGLKKIHNYPDSRAAVKEHEDTWFKWYKNNISDGIEEATRQDDLDGIDYWDNGRGIQLKTDVRAAETSNLFLETAIEQQDGSRQDGWAEHLAADELWFYVPGNDETIRVTGRAFNRKWYTWKQAYEEKGPVYNESRNGGRYTAYGICVPIWVMKEEGSVYPCFSMDWFDPDLT